MARSSTVQPSAAALRRLYAEYSLWPVAAIGELEPECRVGQQESVFKVTSPRAVDGSRVE